MFAKRWAKVADLVVGVDGELVVVAQFLAHLNGPLSVQQNLLLAVRRDDGRVAVRVAAVIHVARQAAAPAQDSSPGRVGFEHKCSVSISI